jgi:AcrR family transcriptional regulator
MRDPEMGQPRARHAGGRPRDDRAREAILGAAYTLVRDHGYANVTMAEIAAEAGTGKQTIYRWWASKSALVLNALAIWLERSVAAKPPTTLAAFLVELCRGATTAAPVLRSLIAEAQHYPALRIALKHQLLDPRRAALRRCLPSHRAAERELIIGAVYGAVLYQLLLDEPLGAAFVRGVTRMVARLR